MKKLLVVLIVLMLCCVSAFAETLELNPEDVKLDLSKAHSYEVELEDQETFAKSSADTVVREGYNYIVDNGSLKMALDLSRYPGILCFTQDKFASFEAYLAIKPEYVDTMLNQLIEDKVNFYLVDRTTNMQVYIYAEEADNVSTMVVDLNTLSEENVQVLTSRIFPGATVCQAGNTRWLKLGSSYMLTIAKGQYVMTEFGGSGDPDADLEDTLDILSYLTIE